MENKNNNIEEIDILDYINIISKHRWMIIKNSFITGVLVLIISFFLQKTYTAITTLLPPDESQQDGLLSNIMGSPLSQLGFQQFGSTSDLFVQILQSRTVMDNVLQTKFKFDDKTVKLIDILGFDSNEKARNAMQEKVVVKSSDEGIISIAIEIFNPELAANVANAFVFELDRINKEKYSSKAKNSRIYIENQLVLTEKKLSAAGDSLAVFQEKYKAIALEEQTRTAIEKAGEIKGEIIAKEVQLGVALQTMKTDNILIIQLKKEIEELKKQYNYLQFGDNVSLADKKEFYIPFADVPVIGLELAELIRDVKVQETVWQLLNQQYYQAKIQEARDTPTVQVLDKAIPPELRTRPKRKLLVLVGGFLAFIISIFWAFIKEYINKIKHEKKELEFVKNIKSDILDTKLLAKKKIAILTQKFTKLF